MRVFRVVINNDNLTNGILISFDGIDSSGKETQVGKLAAKIRSRGWLTEQFETPDYTTSSGRRLKALLQSTDGCWDDLNWREKMKLIAANRMEHKKEVLDILERGGVVIYDRYVPSSMVHMTVDARRQNSNITGEQVAKAVSLLEYVYNGMPVETLSIFLDVPPRVASRLLRERKAQRAELDEVTDAASLQEKIYEEYQRMVTEDLDHFVRVDCCGRKGLMPVQTIASRVWDKVVAKLPGLEAGRQDQ